MCHASINNFPGTETSTDKQWLALIHSISGPKMLIARLRVMIPRNPISPRS
jgi:hypothetical protein